MIDLSEFPVGQRFRTRGGRVARLGLPVIIGTNPTVYGYYVLHFASGGVRQHLCNGRDIHSIGLQSPYDLTRPIYRVPARTRRLPKQNPMPTGYQRQWPHLYQMGGGA